MRKALAATVTAAAVTIGGSLGAGPVSAGTDDTTVEIPIPDVDNPLDDSGDDGFDDWGLLGLLGLIGLAGLAGRKRDTTYVDRDTRRM